MEMVSLSFFSVKSPLLNHDQELNIENNYDYYYKTKTDLIKSTPLIIINNYIAMKKIYRLGYQDIIM